MQPLSRRKVLGSFASVAGVIVARRAGAAPPKETGLSSEGLLVGRPGFQPRTVMPLRHAEIPGFLSREQLAAHHAEYARGVERLKETEQRLQDASVDQARYAELRRMQVAAANAALLHQFFFEGLAPRTVDVPRYLVGHVQEHMGSIESWAEDFTRCALAAKSWATLVYDPYDDRWHNAILDGDAEGVWVGANPLVVCDVGAHAYGKDYPRREEYVAKFLEHVDWEEVAKRYRAVDRK